MTNRDPIAEVSEAILDVVPDYPYVELDEAALIEALARKTGDRGTAIELWEAAESSLRKRSVHDGRLLEWNFFQRIIIVARPLRTDELDRFASVNEVVIPHLIEEKLRKLGGRAFERFMGELLGRIPGYRTVHVTKASHDDGVDFTATYQPDEHALPRHLFGQAKQTSNPITASAARDFIGALNIQGRPGSFGIYVSMAGYTREAEETFSRSNYQVNLWNMSTVQSLMMKYSLGIKPETGTFPVIEPTFWDEIATG